MDPETAAEVLGGMDRYYCCQPVGSSSRRHSMATQLVRQLSDPDPSDLDDDLSEPEQRADWDEVRQRCLSVAVAMLEEAR
jgi:RND superfamily putative drug exporter